MMIKANLFAVLLLPAVALSFSACGDTEDATRGGCTIDSDCAFGQICQDGGACGELPCTSNADCLNGDQACVTVSGADVCAAVECGCIECDACPLGDVCLEGVCEDASTQTACPGGDDDCSDTDICGADGYCRACQGNECPGEDCSTTGCDAGETCNAGTGECEAEATTADACDACTTGDECGAGWGCKPMITGNACLPPCGSNDDCATGWGCQAGVCTPSNFKCTGCIIDGCPDGQACNTNTDQCIAAAPACEGCGNDWECGEGSACHQGICVERCSAGTCASGGSCTTSANQIEVCADGCTETCDPGCSGGTPVCSAGTCVQCLGDDDCGGGTCDTVNNVCQGQGECSGATPYFFENACVACLNNDHCGNDFCDQETHTCSSDVCASCSDPYPACVSFESEFYCVQCDGDDDCGVGGTCNTTTYACEGGTVAPTDPCTVDADCQNAAQTSFSLACHAATGLCYDTAGSCDDVTAFCPTSTGAVVQCKSLFDLFGSLLGTALPPLDTGGGTIPGFCSCDGIGVATCLGGSCVDLTAFDPPTNDGICL